jgi:hypothetical protein
MKNAVFFEVTPCGSCKNRRFVLQLLLAAHVVPSSLTLSTLMMEAARSSQVASYKTHTASHPGGLKPSNVLPVQETAVTLSAMSSEVAYLSTMAVSRRDRPCGLVVRVPGYRPRGPGFDPGAARFSQ